jgi:DNA-binding GntR family transcriptional regulator
MPGIEPADRLIARPSGLAEEVYRRIWSDIMSLRIPPDTKVSVGNLAREFGVSQTPVREAMSMLEANGLVTKRHYTGYQTSPRMDRAQLDELFEFRLLVEPHAARKAAEAMDVVDIAALNDVAGRDAGDQNNFADMDTDFHKMIAQGAGNSLIAEALAKLHIHIHIFRGLFRREVADEALHEHEDIVLAIQQKDSTASEAAMRRHLERSHNRLRSYFKN